MFTSNTSRCLTLASKKMTIRLSFMATCVLAVAILALTAPPARATDFTWDGGAAQLIAKEPTALQLRYLGTLAEVATENNSTIVFPVPIDLFKPFLDLAKQQERP